jgi:hypothetical protein
MFVYLWAGGWRSCLEEWRRWADDWGVLARANARCIEIEIPDFFSNDFMDMDMRMKTKMATVIHFT